MGPLGGTVGHAAFRCASPSVIKYHGSAQFYSESITLGLEVNGVGEERKGKDEA